jgi:tRNA(Leu) C34 or U34 (ribose-2'-O)-methylase TrmL
VPPRSASTPRSIPPVAVSRYVRRCTPIAFFRCAGSRAPRRSTPREALAAAASSRSTPRAAPWEIDLRGPLLFVIGGETRGIALTARALDATLRIPMRGFIPAYNVQAAMAIVAGERLRQESAAGS